MNEQRSKGTLHVVGKNSGQGQICAFGKYEKGFLLLETMPAKSGRKCLRNLCRLMTPKETCDPLVQTYKQKRTEANERERERQRVTE